jgi:acetyltransferase
MSPMHNLPPELVKKALTNIDYANHLAWSRDLFVDGREIVVAEARYALKGDPSVAEFAVSVADQWQGKGLASLLLNKLLCHAATAGIERVVGETLATNAGMLHLARKAGFTVTRSADVRGLMLLDKVLAPELAGTPCGGGDGQTFMAA